MARAKRAVPAKKRRKQVLGRAKGYYGNKSRSYRSANEQVMHSGNYAFRDRRARKGEFRKLWIQRINAACRQNGTTYSVFIAGSRLPRSTLIARTLLSSRSRIQNPSQPWSPLPTRRASPRRPGPTWENRCRSATNECKRCGAWRETPAHAASARGL